MHLEVGETDGEHIGCYMFGIEGDDDNPPSYHSLAICKSDLVEDCRNFFLAAIEQKKELISPANEGLADFLHQDDIRIILAFIENLEGHINFYLKFKPDEEFLNIAGMSIFLRTGIRERQKLRGKYIE